LVFGCDPLVPDGLWERLVPEKGRLVLGAVEPYATHAMARGIATANICGWLRYNFIELGRLGGQFGCQPLEVIKEVMGGWVELDAVSAILVPECSL